MSNMQSNRDRSDKPPAYPITDQTTAADIKNYGNVAKVNFLNPRNDYRGSTVVPILALG